MVNRNSSPETAVETVDAEVVDESPRRFGVANVWDEIGQADVYQASAELTTKVRLIGVPFVVTKAHYRTGAFTRPNEVFPDDYVSLEAVTPPANHPLWDERKIARLRQKAHDDMEGKLARKLEFTVDDFVGPEEFVVINDSSTGVKRQFTGYLAHKGLIVLDIEKLPELDSMSGSIGENAFDQNRDEWKSGKEAATSGIPVRVVFKQGLRVSAYENEANADGSVTFYLA